MVQETIVSIILITFNSRKVIDECLASLAMVKMPDEVTLETIVIDNNSSDGTAQYLSDNHPNGILVLNSHNKGLSEATTQGVKLSHGDYLILANPDLIFNEGLAKFILYGIHVYPDCIVGPGLLNLDGSRQYSIHSRATDITRMFFCFAEIGHVVDKFLVREWFRRRYSYQGMNGTHYPVFQLGTMFMMSRTTLKKVGGIFDERLPLFFTDVDLSMRAEKEGVKRYVLGDIGFKHHRGHSFKGNVYVQRYIFGRDLAEFCRIWNINLLIVRTMFILDSIIGFPIMVFLRIKRPHVWKGYLRFGAETIRGILS